MALTPRRQENSRIVCSLFTGRRSEKCRSAAGDRDAALLRQLLQRPVLPDLVREQSLQGGAVLRGDMLSSVLEAKQVRFIWICTGLGGDERPERYPVLTRDPTGLTATGGAGG